MQENHYGGIEFIDPTNKESMRSGIRYIHDLILADKPLTAGHKEFLLEALDKIAKGSRPDTAFKWRTYEKNNFRKFAIIEAMQDIYFLNTKGTEITKVIQKVSSESKEKYGELIGFEVLKKEWFRNKSAWKKHLDQYYDDMNKAYDELQVEAHRPPS